ncbi:M50 family metallopeptidase [Nocardioides fonticola]|uniref:M50 family metallopeptidase n=1 Tax=Nocardioides fonticola TaxID=450363 RepID=A0ABP7XJJ4_9ACTN
MIPDPVGVTTLLEEVWRTRPLPGAPVVLGTGVFAAAAVLWARSWTLVRLGITTVHEAGHAAVALLVGRRLHGVRVHQDTSGLTLSSGRARGPGLVAVYAAGHLAPGVLGLLAVAALAAGRPVALLAGGVVVAALLLVWVRNLYGLLVVTVIGAALALLAWRAPDDVRTAAAYLVAWLLLLGAPRPVVELLAAGRRRPRGSDVDRLADLTGVPAVLWALVLLAATHAGAVLGATTLAPDLLAAAV